MLLCKINMELLNKGSAEEESAEPFLSILTNILDRKLRH